MWSLLKNIWHLLKPSYLYAITLFKFTPFALKLFLGVCTHDLCNAVQCVFILFTKKKQALSSAYAWLEYSGIFLNALCSCTSLPALSSCLHLFVYVSSTWLVWKLHLTRSAILKKILLKTLHTSTFFRFPVNGGETPFPNCFTSFFTIRWCWPTLVYRLPN